MDIETARRMLELWIAADEAVALGQSYTLANGRQLTRADAKVITEKINYYSDIVRSIENSSPRSHRVVY